MLDALLFTKTSPLIRAVYRDCLWKVKTKEKVLYLTFDDGPVPEATPFVLDELKKWNAKATFFCIGKNVAAHPDLFMRIASEGHAIGNHTYDHLNGWNFSDTEYFDNVEKCAAAFSVNLPLSPINLFRPPYGKLKPSQYRYLKERYKLVMWDVLSFDFDLKTSEEKVWGNVMKHAGEGSVVVFHDSLKARPRLEFALPKTLEYFSGQGFKFEKL